MKKAAIALIALGALGAAQAAGGLKAGLWETRPIRMTMDGKDMLPQMRQADEQMRAMLDKMTPEQRRQVGGALANRGTEPLTQRLCISPEMAAREQPLVPRPAGADCEPPKIEREGNRTRFELACKPRGGGTMTGKGETTVAGDRVTTRLDTTRTDKAGARQTSATETQMKWLGADCGAVKPLDQLARQAAAAAASAPRAPAARK